MIRRLDRGDGDRLRGRGNCDWGIHRTRRDGNRKEARPSWGPVVPVRG
jgi:hypothetical protein